MDAKYAKRVDRASRPDIALLLACCRSCISEESKHRIASWVGLVRDWDELIRIANFHGVLPLLYMSLSHVCAQAVPASAMTELRAHFHANSARNLFLAGWLLRILQFLEAAGISGVAFKGPTLAVAAYENLALREFYDLDVIVKETDFPKAKELFLNHGFTPRRNLTPLEEAEQFRSYHACTLDRTEDGFSVDLHWKIAQEHYAFGLDVEALWSRMARVSFLGREILSISGEDLLMVLCVHGSKHCWERLTWICDVAEMVRAHPELRWDEIMSRSRALHFPRAVLLGLDLAKNLLDAQLSSPVLSAIDADHGIRRVSHLIQRKLFERTRRLSVLERATIFFMTQERFRDRLPHLTYSFHHAVTPNQADTSRLHLPSRLYFLYYPLRAMRLSRAALARVFSRNRYIS